MSKRWTTIFRALANINRIKIIRMLASGRNMTVTEIAGELNISLNATSKHLLLLSSLDALDSTGKLGHVYYSLNPNPPSDLKKSIHLFL